VIALTITCALVCAVLVVAEWRGFAFLRIAAKLVASMAFVAAGVLAFELGRHGETDIDADRVQLGHAIVTGLVVGAIGDACLLAGGTRWFLAGLMTFLLGHLAYVAGIGMIEPAARWAGDAGWLAAVPVAIALAVLVLAWPRLGSQRLPVIAYVVTITVMVIAAIAAARGAALPDPNRWRLVAGASLFFVSDLAVARDRFGTRCFANKLWGLPTYYAGQLLIAWSIADL
jgi:uncharacterized membrane protein YhhN